MSKERSMEEFFKELFEYNHDANQRLAIVFLDSPDKISEKAVQLFNHILNAHQIWNSRIEAKKTALGVWEIRPVWNLSNIDETNYERSLQILHTSDLNNTISYKNSQGQMFSNHVQDILFHIINHSTYHRGQIALEFRQHGLEPLITDYIFYKR